MVTVMVTMVTVVSIPVYILINSATSVLELYSCIDSTHQLVYPVLEYLRTTLTLNTTWYTRLEEIKSKIIYLR